MYIKQFLFHPKGWHLSCRFYVKEDVVETLIVEEPKKEEKVEETVVDTSDVEDDVIEETEDEEITEPTEEITDEE